MTEAATEPVAVVKIGEPCPQCGGEQAGRCFGAMHWTLAIGLFPFGLLVLLLPWRKCRSCGCVFNKNWLKPAPPSEGGQPGPGSPTCWYCEKLPASEKRSEKLPFFKEKGEDFDGTEVTIPQCEVCHSVLASRSRAKWAGLGVGLFSVMVIGGSGEGGMVIAVGIVFGVIGWVVGGVVGKRTGKAKAAAAGLEVKLSKAWKDYPPVRDLFKSGWKLGSAEDEVNRKKAEESVRPEECPVCGSHTGKVGVLRNTLSLTVTNERITAAERCSVCGQWGCRLCMHFHDRDGNVIWKGTSGQVDSHTVVTYSNVKWRHNGCCDCGFGTLNGQTVPMA